MGSSKVTSSIAVLAVDADLKIVCVGSNTPWLRVNSDASLILTGASATPGGQSRAAIRRDYKQPEHD